MRRDFDEHVEIARRSVLPPASPSPLMRSHTSAIPPES
jgi:hypothetical protein